jgi:hypothetical protein
MIGSRTTFKVGFKHCNYIDALVFDQTAAAQGRHLNDHNYSFLEPASPITGLGLGDTPGALGWERMRKSGPHRGDCVYDSCIMKPRWKFQMNTTRLVRSGLQLLGLNMLDYNIARRTKTASILDLMKNLWPQDCGMNLIRIGGQGDGGYLIPDDLEGVEYCFSPGVNTTCDFENHLADFKIKSFLADYSVDGPLNNRHEFVFDKMFLGAFDRGHFMTLASWKDKYIRDHTGDLILQMDIEGHEYEVILSTPDSLLNQFRIIVIEFHHLDRLYDPFAFSLISACFEKLLQDFHVAHIHPNNNRGSVRFGDIEIPEAMEFTFINKRRVRSTRPQQVFPHKLDAENKASYPPMTLPKCWYTSV